MQRTADVSELQLLFEGIAVNLSLLLMLFFALGGPLTKHGATVEAVAMRGSRADCQTSTQVNSQGVVVCGELSLCVGVPDAEHGCSAVRAEYGTSSFYEWCDCRKPADIWDTGPCHSAGWQIGTLNRTRTCRGPCYTDPDECNLESGTHTWKRCVCQ